MEKRFSHILASPGARTSVLAPVWALILALILAMSGCAQGSVGRRSDSRRSIQEPRLDNRASPVRRVLPRRRISPGARLLVAPKVIRRLPVAPGLEVTGTPLQLEVTGRGILRNRKLLAKIVNGQVVASAKRGGARGYLITGVHEYFRRLAQRQKSTGKKRLDCVLLLVDRDLAYGVVAEVLYSINQAGSRCYSVAVNPPPAKALGVASLRISTPRLARVSAGKSQAKWIRQTDHWGQVYWAPPVPMTSLQDIEIN